MKGHTYPDLAARYGVVLCSGCEASGHRRGMVDPDGVVHWNAERRINRSSLRRFLVLVADVVWKTHPHIVDPNPPRWRRHSAVVQRAAEIHRASVFASRAAMEDLGIRIPAYLSRQDKARVRAMLTGAPSEARRSAMGRWAGLR